MNESPLGTALKTMFRKRTERTIRVCDHCATPLIFTFFFPYCERFCLNCGAKGGMLGTGTDVPVTRELLFKKRLIDAIWKTLSGKKAMMPKGQFGRKNCNKCTANGSHRDHASQSEKEWDVIASSFLKRFEGLFTNTAIE